jgi:endonuclease YncB( thermonuclease family)
MIGRRHLWRAAVGAGVGAALLAAPAGGAARAEMLAGPVPARLVAVIDGDTIRVRARIWLDQEVETAVRLFGIDAPELTGACAAERALALDARDFRRHRSARPSSRHDIAHDSSRPRRRPGAHRPASTSRGSSSPPASPGATTAPAPVLVRTGGGGAGLR